MSREYSLAEAAEVLEFDRMTLRAWVRQGCPHRTVQRGKVTEYRLKLGEVMEWREKRAVEAAQGDTASLDLDEAKRRKVAAEAALAELELALKRGEVVLIADVAKVVGEELSAVRAKLLGMPAALAPRVQYQESKAIQAILDAYVNDVLGELGGFGGGVAGGYSPGEGEDAEAEAEADGIGVGGPVSEVEPRGKRRARAVEH